MPTLGELLVADGVLGEEAVADALAAQRERGGRLGTNLIELGYLEEDVLARYLGMRHERDYLYGEIPLDPALLNLIPADVADDLDIVPYRLDGQRLTLLGIDPTTVRRYDQLAFQLNRPLEIVVVPEFRMWELLRRHYKAFRDERGLSQREKYAKNRPDPKKQRLSQGADLIDESEFQALYAQVIAGDGKPPEDALDELPMLEGEALEAVEDEPVAAPVPAAGPPPAPARPALAPASVPAAAPPPVAAGVPESAKPDELYDLERRDNDRRWHKRRVPLDRRKGDRRGAPAEDHVAKLRQEDLPFALPGEDDRPSGPPAARPTAPPTRPDLPVAAAVPPPVAAKPVAPAPPPALALPESPLGLAEAEKLIAEGGRDDIARALVRFGRSKFQRAIVLAVQGDVAAGWDGLGGKLDRAVARKLSFPLAQPSVFQLVHETKSHYLGQFRATPVVVYFLRATGGEVPRTFFLMPVIVGGKVVNLFYADDGHGKIASRDVGDLLLLGQRAGRAYQKLIESKRKK